MGNIFISIIIVNLDECGDSEGQMISTQASLAPLAKERWVWRNRNYTELLQHGTNDPE